MMTEELLEALDGDARERLRWMVLREFGVLPGSREAKALTDTELLRCAGHMVLDLRRMSRRHGEGGRNPTFDTARFERLKEAAR
jgi:hypothetical protein